MGGIDGRPFVLPTGVGEQALVNLGNTYTHNVTIPNGPALFHELTHVWQAKRKHLTEIFLYDARVNLTDRPYDFEPGAQWNQYNLEQQASIVEAWAWGSTRKANEVFDAPSRGKLSIGSPLFHYINRNIRRKDTEGSSGDGRSARQLLKEGGHRRMNQMHSRPPTIWWSALAP
jgi:hypothetical protein